MAKDVILIEDVPGLGEQGKRVKVSDGYARNYLLPKNLATNVTPATLRQLEKKQADYDARSLRLKEEANEMAAKISEMELVIKAKAGSEDKIFGSITAQNVIKAAADEGVKLDKHQVVLEKPIKVLGEHNVAVKLTSEVHTVLKVKVEAE